MNPLSAKNVAINNIYSEEPRNKMLSVKMSEAELTYLAQVARGAGETISSFTRKALSAHIIQTIKAV